MKYKTITTILFFFFLFMPLFTILGAQTPKLLVNKELKQCRTYQPTSRTTPPDGWEFHTIQAIYSSTHKTDCEKIGYTYIEGILEGNTEPKYIIMNNIINGLFLLLLIVNLILYFKFKKKKILKFIPIIIILYLIVYGIANFN